jgi:hypothetical protein
MTRCGAAALAATALVAGCATAQPAGPAAPASAHQHPVGRSASAARYLAIAQAGNRALEVEFGRLHGRDRATLVAARTDLRDVAATERLFDSRLQAISFPAATEATARTLYRVNQARASLTITAAGSVSLRQLGAYEPRLTAANAPVEQAVRIIRRQLGLPPPETS